LKKDGSGRDWFTYIAIILIAALGFSVYLNSLNNGFVWDDNLLVKDNIYIKGLSRIADIMRSEIGEGGRGKYIFYRPIQMFTYALDYAVWRLNSFGYHLTNILLHVICAVILFWFLLNVLPSKAVALVTALFFVSHPIHTEAVAYISGRAESLAAIFALGSFAFYIKYLKTGMVDKYLSAIALFICALFSMEYVIVLPLLFVAYNLIFEKKAAVMKLIPFIAAIVIYFFIRAATSRYPSENLLNIGGALDRLPGFFTAIAGYFKVLVLPLGLHMEYGNPVFSFTDTKAAAGMIILLLSIIYAVKERRDKITLFSVAFFYISLLPFSNVYPLNAYMAEHWLYFPSVGFFLLLSYKLVAIYERDRASMITAIIIIVLLMSYSILTIRQNIFWRGGVKFYERLLKYAPANARIYNNLGTEYNALGESIKAVEMYKKAIEIDPGYANAYNNLGTEYNTMGYNDVAVRAYKRAIALNPAYADAYNNIGISYRELGKNNEAIEAFRKAIELNSAYIDPYINLGNLYSLSGNPKDAINVYREALRADPYSVEAYNNLATEYAASGMRREAIELFKKALQLDPDNVITHGNLAFAYYADKEYGLAIEHYDKAVSLGIEIDQGFLNRLKPYRE